MKIKKKINQKKKIKIKYDEEEIMKNYYESQKCNETYTEDDKNSQIADPEKYKFDSLKYSKYSKNEDEDDNIKLSVININKKSKNDKEIKSNPPKKGDKSGISDTITNNNENGPSIIPISFSNDKKNKESEKDDDITNTIIKNKINSNKNGITSSRVQLRQENQNKPNRKNRSLKNRKDKKDKNEDNFTEKSEPIEVNETFKEHYHDLILERLDFDGFKDVNEKKNWPSVFSVFKTIVKNNNTLLFSLWIDENDLFIKCSVIIFTISIYILFNIFFMTKNLSLHLYKDRDKYLHETMDGKSFIIMNLILPLIVYICVLFIRRTISIKEFLQYQRYKLGQIGKKDKIGPQEILKLHALQTDISKFKNKNQYIEKWYIIIGLIFLAFNWYLTSCFCGIYENSIDCLTMNVFMSMIFCIIFTLVFFLISSFIRIWFKNRELFKMSRWLNPTYLLFGEIKTEPKLDKKTNSDSITETESNKQNNE